MTHNVPCTQRQNQLIKYHNKILNRLTNKWQFSSGHVLLFWFHLVYLTLNLGDEWPRLEIGRFRALAIRNNVAKALIALKIGRQVSLTAQFVRIEIAIGFTFLVEIAPEKKHNLALGQF